jgi:hypothetical protein
MRAASFLAIFCLLAAGCTPNIPVKPEFGISALQTTGDTPPEFLEFNRYDPRLNPVLADQMCATPPTTEVVKALDAVPGEILAAQAKCARYQPWFAQFIGQQPTQ